MTIERLTRSKWRAAVAVPLLSAGMITVKGRIQREGEVVHIVAQHLTDMSSALTSVGSRDAVPLQHGRGDEFHHGSPGLDARSLPPNGLEARDIVIPDRHINSIKTKTRDFRSAARVAGETRQSSRQLFCRVCKQVARLRGSP